MGQPFTNTAAADVMAACLTAFPTARVEDVPQLESTTDTLPYVRVDLRSIRRMSGTPTYTTYRYEYVITYRAAYPASGNLTDAKITAANTLHNALITSPTLSVPAYGTLQDTPEVTFAELDNDGSRAFEMQQTFVIDITGER
jgi:hypothetical protein